MSGQVIGVLVLLALRCSSCLHAGVYRDFPSDGVFITFHYTVFFYIKNINDRFKDDANGSSKGEASENLLTAREKGSETV